MIRFACEHCGKPVRVPEAAGGKKGRCPFCKAVVDIPPPGTAAAEAGAELAAAAALAEAGADETPAPPPPHRIEDAGGAVSTRWQGRSWRKGGRTVAKNI